MAAALLTGFGAASFTAPASAAPVGPSQALTAGTTMTEQVKMKRSRPHGVRKIPKKKGL
ncbi:hypothetical protein [Methylobacterium dankookense]|nr:hypothetical protein [Methylobacterium dankookense]